MQQAEPTTPSASPTLSRWHTDEVFRERNRLHARDHWRRKNHKDGPGKRFRIFDYDQARIVAAALPPRKLLHPNGRILTDEACLTVSAMADAMGIESSRLSTWITKGVFPMPICVRYSASRPGVYTLTEAIAYCRLFVDTLGGKHYHRPFCDCPELITVLSKARQAMHEAMVLHGDRVAGRGRR